MFRHWCYAILKDPKFIFVSNLFWFYTKMKYTFHKKLNWRWNTFYWEIGAILHQKCQCCNCQWCYKQHWHFGSHFVNFRDPSIVSKKMIIFYLNGMNASIRKTHICFFLIEGLFNTSETSLTFISAVTKKPFRYITDHVCETSMTRFCLIFIFWTTWSANHMYLFILLSK